MYPLRRLPHLLAVLALVVTVAACDTTEADSDPTVSGSWVGVANVEGSSMQITLQLTERDQQITGNGTIALVSSVAVNVTGTHNYPNVSMTIRSSGNEDINFNGTVTGDGETLTGNLSGSGFENFAVTLRK